MAKISHQELQHKMVMVRAEVLSPPTDPVTTKEWILELIKALDMEVLLGPDVVYHPEIGNRGLTGIAAIKTSSIQMHCWDEPSPAILMFDVYTCGELRLEVVWKALQVFSPVKISYKFFDREKELVELSSGTF
jgi:S-adenosylmethionine/arginine decarboxylase-like enzyme